MTFQWVPPPQENAKEKEADEQIAIDLGEEYEQALSAATQEEIIDLAGNTSVALTERLVVVFASETRKEKKIHIYIYMYKRSECETQLFSLSVLAILGFHSMMNQDQYHASLLNSGQPVGLGWDGVTKASQPKVYPMEPPNDTDVDATIKQVRDDDSALTDLNWNNIKVRVFQFVTDCFEPLET